jgi:IS605 OrfB family transposase
MILKRSAVVKIITNYDFLPTFMAYTKAYNYTCRTGWDNKEFNGVRLHHLVYPYLRQSLPAQLCTSARMKATESLKSVWAQKNKKISCPKSKLCSIRLDSQSHSVWFEKNEVSILTINGRIKNIKFQSYDYFDQFRDWRRKSADLVYNKGKILLIFIFEKNIPDNKISSENVIGIDRGIRRIAVTSNKQFFGGGRVRAVSQRYQNLRLNLQSCGSRSAKRHLQKISKKENRFRKDVNHCISKAIIQSLPVGSTIILEDLKHIRERCKQRQAQRREFHSWGFYQLEQFLIYKAEAHVCKVIRVDPRYTSQKCSKCGQVIKANRKNQSQFKCLYCNYALNADLNASFNIRNNYLSAISHSGRGPVISPYVSSHYPESVRGLVTSHSLVV